MLALHNNGNILVSIVYKAQNIRISEYQKYSFRFCFKSAVVYGWKFKKPDPEDQSFYVGLKIKSEFFSIFESDFEGYFSKFL